MEKYTSVEEVSGKYNREEAAKEAHGDALTLLTERLGEFSEVSTAEKITALQGLIAEYAATEDGTGVPKDNNHRHLVEALATLLAVEEKRSEMETVSARYPEFA